jgi:hypothetical protein
MKLARAPAAFATGRKATAPRVSVAVRASNNPNLECKQPILSNILAVGNSILSGTTYLRFILRAHTHSGLAYPFQRYASFSCHASSAIAAAAGSQCTSMFCLHDELLQVHGVTLGLAG